jgi:predicted transcriptional regulator
MATHTIKIDPEAHERLRRLAESEGQTMQQVASKAIEEFELSRFFDKCDEAYAALRANPQLWRQELAERAEWDVILLDGLEDDEEFE